jgi:hypothetical protein
MGHDERSSGSNAGVVILIALLVLAVPCCGGVALLGLGVFSFRAASAPANAGPVTFEDNQPIVVDETGTVVLPEPSVSDGPSEASTKK